MSRSFSHGLAVRKPTPLLIGITGPSGSGKTYSAIEMATGICRVSGGIPWVIDTEHNRATHYADRFKFEHVPMDEPYGPLDYLAAIESCVAGGATCIVVDSFSHEHNGPGGVMSQSEEYLEAKCGDDEAKRRRNFMLSLVKPKLQRNRLNHAIIHLGVNLICCYRAKEKIKPVAGKEPEQLGWQAETTSPIVYEMTVRFLLTPGCDGVPDMTPEERAAKLAIKNPIQFREMLKPGMRLSADLGEKLAKWCAGPVASVVDAAMVAAWPTMGDADKRAAWPQCNTETKAAIKALKGAQSEPGANG